MQRTAVVTGATGGIGSAVVTALRSRGVRVFALGRDAERLERLAGAGVTPIAFELGGSDDAPAALRPLDRLDALVHCAGIAPVLPVAETTAEVWAGVLAANLVGPARLTAALLPALRTSQGAVVLIGMAPGMRDVPRWSAYLASKAALREFAGSLRAEERGNGVRVALISPGGTATPLLGQVREAFGRRYDPAEALPAEVVATAVADLVTGPSENWRDEVEVILPG